MLNVAETGKQEGFYWLTELEVIHCHFLYTKTSIQTPTGPGLKRVIIATLVSSSYSDIKTALRVSSITSVMSCWYSYWILVYRSDENRATTTSWKFVFWLYSSHILYKITREENSTQLYYIKHTGKLVEFVTTGLARCHSPPQFCTGMASIECGLHKNETSYFKHWLARWSTFFLGKALILMYTPCYITYHHVFSGVKNQLDLALGEQGKGFSL